MGAGHYRTSGVYVVMKQRLSGMDLLLFDSLWLRFQLNLSVDTLNLINQAKYTERCLIMSNAHIEVFRADPLPANNS